MKPIGPLMREHRLIERMVTLLDYHLAHLKGKPIDPSFLLAAVDFFRTYADRTHHGKEEDIFFRELAKKNLQAEHKRIMDELIQERVAARKIVDQLAEAGTRYSKVENQSLEEISNYLRELVRFYPVHIVKEDKQFFYPILEYFSKTAQDAMLAEFWEFDRKLIHEKYLKVVETNENNKA
jgi:hemerythrin-like domain-containing protein